MLKGLQKSDAGVFVSTQWIHKNRTFATAPSYVWDALRDRLAIPSPIETALFGSPSASILTFISNTQLETISPEDLDTRRPSAADFFSNNEPVIPALSTLRTLPIPPLDLVEELLKAVGQQWLTGALSLRYSHLSTPAESTTVTGLPPPPVLSMPLYVLSIWRRAYQSRSTYQLWAGAETWLTAHSGTIGPLAQSTRLLLTRIPCSGRITAFEGEPDTSELAPFLSREWLSSDSLNMMLEVIRTELVDMNTHAKHTIWSTYWTQTLQGKFSNAVELAAANNSALPPPSDVLPSWLLEDGQHFTTGDLHSIGLIFNLDGLHWVAAIVDFTSSRILYGDSLGK
ncbi:hypothetical protein FOMPIDRAFT_1056839, partial [Fomitopsis schrenkii]